MAAEMDVMRRERGHALGNPLFRTKSIEGILADSGAPEHRLKRTLTAWDLTGLGIGAIIGTGIFVLIGTAIVGDAHRPGAGPGIMVSFILSGITCALAALCYAEFAAMIPVAGSAYTYSYATLGEFLAWLTGWNLILEYGVACVAVAIGWSGYFNNILKMCGLELPYWATHAPGSDGGIANLPAAIIVLLVTGILIVGVKESARATCAIVVIKLAVIIFFITVGVSSVDPANWSPFMPFGFAGVVVLIGPGLLGEFGSHLLAQFALLGASLGYALSSVYARRFSRDWEQVARDTLLACEEALAERPGPARASYAADSA